MRAGILTKGKTRAPAAWRGDWFTRFREHKSTNRQIGPAGGLFCRIAGSYWLYLHRACHASPLIHRSQTMLTTVEIIEMIRTKYTNATNYQIARALVTQVQVVNSYLKWGKVMTAVIGTRAAELLGLNIEHVLACLAVEREKNPNVRRHIRRTALRTAKLLPMPPKVPREVPAEPGKRRRVLMTLRERT